MDDLGDNVPSTTKSAYSVPWGNGESLFDDGFDFSSDPGLPGEDVKAGQDEEGLSRSEKGRGFGDSPEHDASTSHSEARDYAFNSSVPSGRMTWLGIGICDVGEVDLLEEMHGAVTKEEGDAGSRVLWSPTAMLSIAKQRSILGMRALGKAECI